MCQEDIIQEETIPHLVYCEWCGEPIEARTSDTIRRYCTPQCRELARLVYQARKQGRAVVFPETWDDLLLTELNGAEPDDWFGE